MLRAHQQRMDEICAEIRSGQKITSIIAQVTPGGGKSALPAILAARLIKPWYAEFSHLNRVRQPFERLCWIVPRLALQEQAEEAFTDRSFRKMVGHEHLIRVSTNETNPCRGLAGYTTTYSALAADTQKLNAAEFAKHRYLLVLDEMHHIAGDSAAQARVGELVAKAALVLYMSGTLERGRKEQIAFMPYAQRVADVGEKKQRQELVLADSADTRIITYTRADALAERAIIPIHFTFMDGSAEWKGKGGSVKSVSSFRGGDKKLGKEALVCALSSQYANDVLDACMADWMETRKTNPRAKLLIVGASMKLAAAHASHVAKKWYKKVGVATMEEGSGAIQAIRAFKSHGEGRLDLLSTVGMAYEGLDVKAITHIACLTLIRSVPWITQMLARATRYDPLAGPWDRQEACVFLPDDQMMRDTCEAITREEKAYAKGHKKEGTGKGGGVANLWGEIVPVKSGAHAGLKIKMPTAPSALPAPPELTPSQREAALRESIEHEVRAFARRRGKPVKTVNQKIVHKFGKSRTEMSLPELEKVEQWARRNLA